jgi:hypothetical protein
MNENPFQKIEDQIESKFEELKSLIIQQKAPQEQPEGCEYLYSLRDLAQY